MVSDPTLRTELVLAGHRGQTELPRRHLDHVDPALRAVALSALERTGTLDDDDVAAALRDPDPSVRRTALQFAARRPGLSLTALLEDADPTVVEVAAWACGEQETVTDPVFDQLCALVRTHDDALVRESAVAALGAIGDERGEATVLAALDDKATVRRRAVLALAAFSGPGVEPALRRALDDRDWQVRQGAEDLLVARGDLD